MNGIILFDGVCNFCNNSVQFIIKRDRQAYFKFTSLQSDAGQVLLQKYGVPATTDSMILIENDKYYTESEAVIRITKHLHYAWPLLQIAIMIPKPLRNKCYQFIAENRLKWFGQRDECMLPTQEQKQRFL